MKKQSALKPKRPNLWLMVAGVLAVLLVAAYLFRGWLRVTVAPAVVSTVYGRAVENTLEREMAALGDPFNSLGYDEVEKLQSGCEMVAANGFTTQFSCTYNWNVFQEVSQDTDDKTTMNTAASDIQAALQDQGWEGEFGTDGPYTSLVTLVKNINEGIDYTPNASYHKTFGDISCSFSSNTAFSSPKPAAISSQFVCTRDVSSFGQPITP